MTETTRAKGGHKVPKPGSDASAESARASGRPGKTAVSGAGDKPAKSSATKQADSSGKGNKTMATSASVDAYVAAISDESRRQDCLELIELMSRLSGESPVMWGTSIVGFGSYHYRYESGREGESCRTGFSSRAREISIYLLASGSGQERLLAKLGAHRMGACCLYVRRLDDIDRNVLEKIVSASLEEVRRRHG